MQDEPSTKQFTYTKKLLGLTTVHFQNDRTKDCNKVYKKHLSQHVNKIQRSEGAKTVSCIVYDIESRGQWVETGSLLFVAWKEAELTSHAKPQWESVCRMFLYDAHDGPLQKQIWFIYSTILGDISIAYGNGFTRGKLSKSFHIMVLYKPLFEVLRGVC